MLHKLGFGFGFPAKICKHTEHTTHLIQLNLMRSNLWTVNWARGNFILKKLEEK